MDKSKIPNNCNYKFSLSKKNNLSNKKHKDAIEFIDEEKLKKIEAYLEWEQEYYLIIQSYLLEKA